MGIYLNPNNNGFQRALNSKIYVDKTELIDYTNEVIMTLLIHLGYLAYKAETKEVFIPNEEIREEYITAIQVSNWQEVRL